MNGCCLKERSERLGIGIQPVSGALVLSRFKRPAVSTDMSFTLAVALGSNGVAAALSRWREPTVPDAQHDDQSLREWRSHGMRQPRTLVRGKQRQTCASRGATTDDRCFISLCIRLSPLRSFVCCLDSHPRVETRGCRMPSLRDFPLPIERGGGHRRCRRTRQNISLLHEVSHMSICVHNGPLEICPSSRARDWCARPHSACVSISQAGSPSHARSFPLH